MMTREAPKAPLFFCGKTGFTLLIPSCNQNEYQAARKGATQAYEKYVEEHPTMPTT
jgi:hypothetical protein